ncbi:MAG: hypothetical protein COW63_19355 [Bacteroidetes bacterium CG18_big_fil_WC_8_21_14_2_50_41_14]|nr:MAG: hypothetical protein COW63_19355 [Bacteroidetes bacterium CG18_big_fil_WC_8_21_14_2_50_41_14]PIY31283.1 MAG: hypothetical protein COZ08_09150 [Bacteroidetes bacterium CG_4_10_14_3_um_filter_42_6]PJB55383.1 MAG: hypothetical protein CO098_16595 [Bacteroidetes bacterium CG_4_9_14_3_um_filter_41_19]
MILNQLILRPANSAKILVLVLLWGGLFFSGCDMVSFKEDQGRVLAQVEGDYLFLNDLAGVVPQGISHSDSIDLAKNFINNWVKNRLMIAQAERNLTDEQLDFSKQLEDYRNSLVIYRYETLLIDQELDTVVTDAQIMSFYQSHLGDFELKENILRAYYAIVNSETPLLDQVLEVFDLPDALAVDSLLYFEKNDDMLSLSVDTSYWMSFFQFQQIIPIESYNQELFLKNKRLIRIEENGMVFLVKVVNFKIKDDISPLEVERQDIRHIIINQRKVRLIKKVRDDIYKKALYNNDFEIF